MGCPEGDRLSPGLQAPRVWHVLRLARVADAAGLHEVIVFCMENTEARYPDGLVDVDEDGDGRLHADATERLWQALKRSLGVVSELKKTEAVERSSCLHPLSSDGNWTDPAFRRALSRP